MRQDPDTILGYPVEYTDDLPSINGNEIMLGDLWIVFKNLYIQSLAEAVREYADKEFERLRKGEGTGDPIGIIGARE